MLGRWCGTVEAPYDHGHLTDVALGDPADLVLVVPGCDAGRAAEITTLRLAEGLRRCHPAEYSRRSFVTMRERTSSMRLLIDEIPSALGTLDIVVRDGRLCAADFHDCHARMMATVQRRYGPVDLSRVSDQSGISSRILA